jgi:hypothetical protein
VQVNVLTISVESYEPDYVWGHARDLPRSQLRGPLDPFVGRLVLVVGKSAFKGYLGYVRSLALQGIAHVELEANHNIVPVADSDAIDLYGSVVLKIYC